MKKTQTQLIKSEGFAFDADTHSYYFDGRPMTGCTTILGVLAKPALIQWAARMATEYLWEFAVDKNKDGKIDLKELESALEDAKQAHTKKRDKGAQEGSDTHAQVEAYIKECIATNDGFGKPELMSTADSSLHSFIGWAAKEEVRFLASEAQFYSKSLFVAGTADLIFEKDGKRYIGDVKTYKRIWDRAPFYQMAGYALMAEEMGVAEFDGYCIINLPKERVFNPDEDVRWSWDVDGDTAAFKSCVTIYRQNANF